MCSLYLKSHSCQSARHDIVKTMAEEHTLVQQLGQTDTKTLAKREEHHLLSRHYEGVCLPHSSFIQSSTLLSSFATKQKLPRYSPESSTELCWRLCHVTMETFPWHSTLQKQTRMISGKLLGGIWTPVQEKKLYWSWTVYTEILIQKSNLLRLKSTPLITSTLSARLCSHVSGLA